MNYIMIYKIAGFDMPGYSIRAELDGLKLDRMKYYGYSKRDAVLGECNTDWAVDELILRSATDTTVKTTAARILEYLTGEKNSPIYRDGKKQRVSNIYDGGYHYEMIYRPERVATLDY